MAKLLVLIMFAVMTTQAAAQPYPTGLAEPTAAEKQWAAENVRVIRSRADLPGPRRMAVLPSRVVNIQYLPAVGRQVFGSCTSWAVGYYYKTWQEAKEHGWTRPDPSTHPERVMSPSFIFNLANAGVPFSGTSFNANYQYLMDYGICSCAEMDANADPYSWPNETQYLAAFPQRAKSVASIVTSSDAGFEALKAHLAGGDLACFSMVLYNNFTSYPAEAGGINNDVYYDRSGGMYIATGAGGSSHALCVIGYDDNKSWTDGEGVARKGAVLVVNSWGTTWGANLAEAGSRGFIWISYDYFKANAADVTTMVDRIGYQPKLTGTYHVTHGRIAELSIELLAGDRDNPVWKKSILPSTGGLRSIDATVAFDATDNATTETLSWWLQISDVYLTDSRFQPPATGEISSFKIKRPDGTIWESPDCPVQTVESNLVNAYAWANIGLLQRHKTAFDAYNPAISESVWGDVDGDGDEDAFFVSSETSGTQLIYRPRLMRNDGGWSFVEVNSGLTGQSGGMALGDYDGDGLPDLVLIGTETHLDGNYTTLTRLMHNEGQCQFRDSGITLPNAANRPEWIDYNNDGRLDLVLNKCDENYMSVGLVVLLNNGNGTFTDSGLLLPYSKVYAWADYNRDGKIDCAHIDASGYATVSKKTGSGMETVALPVSITPEAFAWGDVDNDGWLDLAVCGWNEYFKRTGCVLRNNKGTFVQYATIPFVQGGGLDWGDVDNDGLVDLCVWGDYGTDSLVADRNIRTRIYRNNGNGTFTSLGFNLWDVGSVMGGNVDYVRLFDIDRDGDLDLAACGPGRSASYPQPRKFALYENAAAQKSGLNRVNTPPTVPTGLINQQTVQNGTITLAWSASTDAQTPSAGLTYDVRVGSNPGWNDLMPADMSMPIDGRHGRPALSSSILGVHLEKVGKAFYWSVRAIDPAQGVSDWTAPQLFVPKGATAPGDVNSDGSINVADLIQTVRMATGATAVNVAKADRNADGGVDLVDSDIMAAMLLADEGPGERTLACRSIDTAGGTVTTTGVKVGIPKGAFSSANTIMIEKVRGADAANGRISPTFRISGIPSSFAQPIYIRLHATASTGGKAVYGSIGEVSLHPSLGMLSNGTRKVTTTSAGGGDYVIRISPPVTAKAASLDEWSAPKPMAGSAQGYQLTIDVDLDNHTAVWANSHFSISFDASQVDLAHVIALGASLEDSYNMLKSAAGGSFSYSGRTSWPVSVTVCKLSNNGIFGEFTSSKLGDNYGYIEINSDNIANHVAVRTTAIHEYFHLVQALYDPRYAFTKAVMGGESLWLAEAASVWSEHLLAPSGYVSPILNNNINAPLNGMIAGAQAGGKAAQDHGYGMASLIGYLVSRSSAAVVSKIFTSIKAGAASVDAVRANSPGGNFDWWPEYLIALVRGSIVPYDSSDVSAAAGTTRQFKIETANDIEKIKYFAESIPDLSGRLHMAVPLYSGFDAKHKLACRLTRDEGDNLKLNVLKFKATQPTTLLGEGVLANGAWKFEVPDLQTLKTQGGWRLLPLVTNKKATDPAAGKTPYELKVAVVGEGTRAFNARTVKEQCYGFNFPTLSFAGSLQGSGWANWTNIDIGYFMYYAIDVPALTPIDYKVTAAAAITEGTYTTAPDGAGDYEVYTVSAIKTYKFEYWPTDVEAQPTSMYSTTGTFNFTLSRDATTCGGNIYAVYDVVRSRYNKDNVLQSQSTDADMETAVVGFTLMP